MQTSATQAKGSDAGIDIEEDIMQNQRTLLMEAKTSYLAQMNQIYHKKTSNSVLMNQNEYKLKLARLLELNSNQQTSKRNSDYRLLKMYEINVTKADDGQRTAKLIKRGTQLPYVPFEDLFDILHSAHVQLKHAGRNSLQRHLRTRYSNVTKDCIMAYLSTCKNCPRPKRLPNILARKWMQNVRADEDDDDDLAADACGSAVEQCSSPTNSIGTVNDGANTRTTEGSLHHYKHNNLSNTVADISATPSTSYIHSFDSISNHGLTQLKQSEQISHVQNESFTRGQVDVFDMQGQDGEFRFVLRYTNLVTREIRLRPLRYGNAKEAADVLVDIYCEQGAPAVIQSLNGREFAQEVISEVFNIWPNCRQLHASYKPMLPSLANESSESTLLPFLSQIREMAKQSFANSWVKALRHLQWKVNTTYHPDLQRSPIERALGRIPQLGLRSSRFLDAIYDKARSEEEIMEFLNDAEMLRSSVFSQQSTASISFPLNNNSSKSLMTLPSSNISINNPNNILMTTECLSSAERKFCQGTTISTSVHSSSKQNSQLTDSIFMCDSVENNIKESIKMNRMESETATLNPIYNVSSPGDGNAQHQHTDQHLLFLQQENLRSLSTKELTVIDKHNAQQQLVAASSPANLELAHMVSEQSVPLATLTHQQQHPNLHHEPRIGPEINLIDNLSAPHEQQMDDHRQIILHQISPDSLQMQHQKHQEDTPMSHHHHHNRQEMMNGINHPSVDSSLILRPQQPQIFQTHSQPANPANPAKQQQMALSESQQCQPQPHQPFIEYIVHESGNTNTIDYASHLDHDKEMEQRRTENHSICADAHNQRHSHQVHQEYLQQSSQSQQPPGPLHPSHYLSASQNHELLLGSGSVSAHHAFMANIPSNGNGAATTSLIPQQIQVEQVTVAEQQKSIGDQSQIDSERTI